VNKEEKNKPINDPFSPKNYFIKENEENNNGKMNLIII